MKDAPPGRRLDLNESPYPPSSEIIDAVAAAAAGLNRYPTVDDPALLAALAQYAGAPADRIVLAAGSNELLHLAPLLAEARPGDEIVLPEPSFPTYGKVAAFCRLTAKRTPLTPAGAVDVAAILAAITDRTRIVAVPTPNNPTGGWLGAAEIARLARETPPHTLLHLDEAYYEFGQAAGAPASLPLLARAPAPWLATRSFSKAFGLAGARIGYGIASSADLAARWRAMRPNFNISSLSLAAGRAALAHRDAGARRVAEIIAERDRLADGLRGLGLPPLPSAANFLAFPAARLGGLDAAARLAEQGVRLAGFSLGGAPYLRATIGTSEDSAALLSALARALT